MGAEARSYTPPLSVGSKGDGKIAVLTSSSEESPVRTGQSPASEPDLEEPDPASSSSSHESLTLFSPAEDGFFLRMFPASSPPVLALPASDEGKSVAAFYQRIAEQTSQSSEVFSHRSGFTTSPGECWIVDTSECPSGGGVSSSLPDVLEADVPPRFFLSPKAAAGILRRAADRKRELPYLLKEALFKLSTQSPEASTATRPKQDTSSQEQSDPINDQEATTPEESLQEPSPGDTERAPTQTQMTPSSPQMSLLPLPEDPASEHPGDDKRMTSTSSPDWTAPTLTTKNEPASSGQAREAWMEASAANLGTVRRMTPTECERLQGFPDGWTIL